MLPRESRLKRKSDFKRGYAHGRVARGRLGVVYYLSTQESGKRVGVVVSTKVGSAVVRNRIKRRLRVIARLHMAALKEGARVILVSRVRARDASFSELAAELERLLRELGALEPAPDSGKNNDS